MQLSALGAPRQTASSAGGGGDAAHGTVDAPVIEGEESAGAEDACDAGLCVRDAEDGWAGRVRGDAEEWVYVCPCAAACAGVHSVFT